MMQRRPRGSALLAVALALSSLLGALRPAASPAAAEAPTAVLGWVPGVTADVPPGAPISIYFNRPMDRASVVGAWQLSPSVPGSFSWHGTGVTFTPSYPLRSGSTYRLTILGTARSAGGLPLGSPFSVQFSTGDRLRVDSYAPRNGTVGVPMRGFLSVTFSHPMVPLQGLSAGTVNPPGWSVAISPAIAGHGSWLGTSTWVFHPDQSLQASTRYTVRVSGRTRDAWGELLGHDLTWSFRTITPEVFSRSPRNGTEFVDPRTSVQVTFNQPMDHASTNRAFSLFSGGFPVAGTISWKGDTLVFRPAAPLSTTSHTVTIAPFARSLNRQASLGQTVRWRFRIAPLPRVVDTQPEAGATAYDNSCGYCPRGPGPWSEYSATLLFNTPMDKRSLDRHLTVSPQISHLQTSLSGPDDIGQFHYDIFGDFQPSAHYTITVGPGVTDQFKRSMAEPYTLAFKTARRHPSLALYGMPGGQGAISFSAGRVVDAPIQFMNVPKVIYTLIRTTPQSLFTYCCYNGTPPSGKTVRVWSETPAHPLNRVQNLTVRLAAKDGSPLPPGLYWLGAEAPDGIPGLPPGQGGPSDWEAVVVTNVTLTVKTGGNGTLVWATSAATGQPVAGLHVRLLDYQGATADSGVTGKHGVFFSHRAVSGGSPTALVDDHVHYGLARTFWAPNTSSAPTDLPVFWWPHFGSSSNGTYLYTDRPVYRPGQTVHFRGILWRARDAVYSSLGSTAMTAVANDPYGRRLYQATIRLDSFGAVHGSFRLPPNGHTGDGIIWVGRPRFGGVSTTFTVAEYRKPEFLTTVTGQSAVQGQRIKVTAGLRYVFGAPVTRAPVHWIAYAQPLFESPPSWDQYTFYNWEELWQENPFFNPSVNTASQFGKKVALGKGATDGRGRLAIQVPVNLANSLNDETVTVEATGTDLSHQSVSGRVQVPVYRSALAIGLLPASYVVPVGQAERVDVVAVRHDGTPIANQTLTATVVRRTYTNRLKTGPNGQSYWQAVPVDTPVTTETIVTDAGGKTGIALTPANGGEYVVTVSGKDTLGNTAETAVTVDASAEGYSDWGLTSSTSISLKPDRTVYRVGDTAHILIAAPFDNATALITVERGTIRRYWIRHLTSGSSLVDVPVTLDDIPNIYVSVTVYRGWRDGSPPDWRYGMTPLHVRVDPRHLVVHLRQNGYRHHPGDRVTYTVTTTDAGGHPVSAQLSLALVDTAVLALKDEIAPDILQAFYSDQPLGVSTGSDGVLSIDHLQVTPSSELSPVNGTQHGVVVAAPAQAPKTGGGGPSIVPSVTVRSRFADTAYWTGALLTNAAGRSSVSLTLPDNATTWRLDARGVAAGERVGQGQIRTLATKDIVVRPVVPRFLTEGDTLRIGAVLNNNLDRTVAARLFLRVAGLRVLSRGAPTVSVPARGERSVWWSVSVASGSRATVTVTAIPQTAGVQADAVRLAAPVHPPLTDETVAAAGQVFGNIRQMVIVPRNAVPRPGELTVRVSASLTAGLGAAFGEFQPRSDESNEDVADRVLAAASLRSLPLAITGLSARTQRRLPLVVAAGVQKLLDHQYPDGGWPWYNTDYEISDPSITADAVQALYASGERSGLVGAAINRARVYLRGAMGQVSAAERAHLLLVLALSGSDSRTATEQLYRDSIRRSHLDPGPLADLGRALGLGHDGTRAGTVVSSLDSEAVVSATGAHWESTGWDYWSGSAIESTIEVLHALVVLSPHDPFVPAASRWLMLARDGSGWDCPHDSAQAIAALAAYARAAREGTADYSYRVTVDGAARLQGGYGPGNQRQVRMLRVPVAGLGRSRPNPVVIGRQAQGGAFGPGPLYYLARLHYYLRAGSIAPLNQGVTVSRRYLNLQGQTITSAPAGSVIKVQLTIRTTATLFYADIEDPIPAGCEPIDESLNTSQQGLFRPPWWWGQLGTVQDLNWYLLHSDLHDNRVSLYAYFLPPGVFRYTYFTTATVPGRFEVAPTHAAETFFPEVFGRSAGQTFTVR